MIIEMNGGASLPDIDYVITWVDGVDKHHAESREKYLQPTKSIHPSATSTSRFTDNGEIYYQIASILKYAPFIRKIYIVTDNQEPKFLDDFVREGLCSDRFINIVSHDEIFSGLNAARPSFNSLSIEAVINRIEGLSENFIYANDDFFINKPLSSRDFFIDGSPAIHGSWINPAFRRFKVRLKKTLKIFSEKRITRPSYTTLQERGAILAGIHGNFLLVHHHPHPVRQSTLATFYEENPDILEHQVSFRFRSNEQYIPVSLANHLEIKRHGVIPAPARPIVYIDPRMSDRKVRAEIKAINIEAKLFACIQSLDEMDPDLIHELHQALTTKFSDYLPLSIQEYLLNEIYQGSCAAVAIP